MQTYRLVLTGLALIGVGATLTLVNGGCAQTLCERRYTIRGTVTDALAAPLAGVTVKIGGQTLATTDSNGLYTATTATVRTPYTGRTLTFELTGYVTSTSTAFTSTEAGDAACDNITLTRDATLSP